MTIFGFERLPGSGCTSLCARRCPKMRALLLLASLQLPVSLAAASGFSSPSTLESPQPGQPGTPAHDAEVHPSGLAPPRVKHEDYNARGVSNPPLSVSAPSEEAAAADDRRTTPSQGFQRSLATITDFSSLQAAVTAWCDNPASAESTYGPIEDWDVSSVEVRCLLMNF